MQVKQLYTPDLHALAAGAQVLAEQDAVHQSGSDEEEQLSYDLTLQLRLHAVLLHAGVEHVELLQDGGHAERLRPAVVLAVLVHAIGALAETGGLHAGDSLETLVLQHPRDCTEREWINKTKERKMHYNVSTLFPYWSWERARPPSRWWTDGRCWWRGRWESAGALKGRSSSGSSCSGEECCASWTPVDGGEMNNLISGMIQ